MEPKKIVALAKKRGLDTIAITDHGTTKGAIAAREYSNQPGITIIVGIEVKTDIGDILGLKVEEDINGGSWENVTKQIHDVGGLVVLPHPYRLGNVNESVMDEIDLVEIWNSRCTREQNENAVKLAERWNKGGIAGSDAHRYSEIGNVVVHTSPNDFSVNRFEITNHAKRYEIGFSQITKMIRTKQMSKLLLLGQNKLWKILDR